MSRAEAELNALKQSVAELEGRLYGNAQAQGNHSSGGYSVGAPSSPSSQAVPPVITVTNESEIDPHIRSWNFLHSGQRACFYVSSTDKFVTAWHDATIPKTITKTYLAPQDTAPQGDIDFLAAATGEAQGDGVLTRLDDLETATSERFDRLEGGLAEIHALVTGLMVEATEPSPKPLGLPPATKAKRVAKTKLEKQGATS